MSFYIKEEYGSKPEFNKKKKSNSKKTKVDKKFQKKETLSPDKIVRK